MITITFTWHLLMMLIIQICFLAFVYFDKDQELPGNTNILVKWFAGISVSIIAWLIYGFIILTIDYIQ